MCDVDGRGPMLEVCAGRPRRGGRAHLHSAGGGRAGRAVTPHMGAAGGARVVMSYIHICFLFRDCGVRSAERPETAAPKQKFGREYDGKPAAHGGLARPGVR